MLGERPERNYPWKRFRGVYDPPHASELVRIDLISPDEHTGPGIRLRPICSD